MIGEGWKISTFLPFLAWFSGYKTRHLKRDVFSGLTVALVLIPQSMAYARLAGLPSYYGLYAAFLPPAVAALFGSSRQLATGPVAVASLLTASALEPLAVAGSEAYIAYAVLLALMAGVFQFALGMFRLGLVVNFISHPVINGFTNAAAIIIAAGQLPELFGVVAPKADKHYQTVLNVFSEAAYYLHWPTLLMAVFAFAIMVVFKKLSIKVPGVLVAVAVTTVLSWATGFERKMTVPLSSIDEHGIRSRIVHFNAAGHEIRNMAEKRARLADEIKDAQSRNLELLVIDKRRETELLQYRMNQKQAAADNIRRGLYRVLLEGGRNAAGEVRFFERGTLPDDCEKFGGTWRIRIDGEFIDSSALKLCSGGKVVGTVPDGLPPFSFPSADGETALKLLPSAVIIALLGFMEAISIAKAMAAKTGNHIDPNQELIGQGLANIAGSLGRGYPVAGSFSRSAVNLQNGAVSGMSSVFTTLAVAVALLFFTPLLYHLPRAVLGAIIMMAAAGLLNIRSFIHAWRAQWFDGAISVTTFACTLWFAPHLDHGIMVGVGLSLGVFLYRSMRPKVVDLSLGRDMAVHDVLSYGLRECRFIDAVRFDGPLFFANASYLEDQIRHRRKEKKDLKHIIIAAEGINDMDASGEEALALTVERLRSARIQIALSGVNEEVMRVMRRTHLLARIGEDHIYSTMTEAIRDIYERAHRGEKESKCPLSAVRLWNTKRIKKGI